MYFFNIHLEQLYYYIMSIRYIKRNLTIYSSYIV